MLIIKRKYLFKCDKCNSLITISLEDERDIKDASEDNILLECPCGGYYFILRD